MAIDAVTGVQYTGYKPNTTQVKAAGPVKKVESVTIENQSPEKMAEGSVESKKEGASEQIKKAVSDINKRMENTSTQFGIHEGTGRVTIKIVDKETKEVLKEFPAEKTLEMIEKAWELAGIMVDSKL